MEINRRNLCYTVYGSSAFKAYLDGVRGNDLPRETDKDLLLVNIEVKR